MTKIEKVKIMYSQVNIIKSGDVLSNQQRYSVYENLRAKKKQILRFKNPTLVILFEKWQTNDEKDADKRIINILEELQLHWKQPDPAAANKTL